MKVLLLCATLLSFLIVGCKEKNFNLKVEGTVLDESLGGGVAQADVQIQKQAVGGGVFSTDYVTFMDGLSNSEGKYSLEFDRENVISYRVQASKDNYFSSNFTINPDLLMPGKTYVHDLGLRAKSDISFHIFNEIPVDGLDQLTLKILDADFPCNCCTSQQHVYTGADVDTSFTCSLWGERWQRYHINIVKDTLQYSYVDSVFCPAFLNTTVEIAY